MDETSDFDTDFYDYENNGFTVIAEEYLYIDLQKLCRILLREWNTNNNNHNQILRILLRNKEKYENLRIMGDIVSNEMHNFITYLIEIHCTSGNIKNHIEMKIRYCDSILNEIIEAKNEYIHSSALNDIATRHDRIYNTSTPRPRRGRLL